MSFRNVRIVQLEWLKISWLMSNFLIKLLDDHSHFINQCSIFSTSNFTWQWRRLLWQRSGDSTWKIATAELEANESAWWFYNMKMLSTQRAISAEFDIFFVVFTSFIRDCNIRAFLVGPYNQLQRLRLKRRLHGCLACPNIVHRMFRHLHGCNDHCQVFSVFKTVAQRSTWRLVAHRSFKWGRREAHVLLWLQNGCTMVSKCLQHCAKGGFTWTSFWTNKWVVGYLRLYEAHVMSL